MATKKKALQAAAGQAGGEALYVEDVFSTYLYDGTNTSRDITNGIDLDGEGGMVWIKARSGTYTRNHFLFDTERGATKGLSSNTTGAETTYSGDLNAFNTDGFSLGTANNTNSSANDYASWTFRKAPGFFDVVTYTGDGNTSQTISHNLGCEVGMMIVKDTTATGNWNIYHKSLGATGRVALNLTNAFYVNTGYWNDTAPTSTEFTVGASGYNVNNSGNTYVAYLFAHNDGDGEFGETGDQDIIKCGSYTGTGGAQNINLGFEPQWILIKNSSAAANWTIFDCMRGMAINSDPALFPNASDAEYTAFSAMRPTPNGLDINNTSWDVINEGSKTYIYIAIRRPMKTPESGTEVFAIDTRSNAGSYSSSTPAYTAGFYPDFALNRDIDASVNTIATSRLTNSKLLYTNLTNSEGTNTSGAYLFDKENGWGGSTSADSSFYAWMWKRAPGFFDVVCYEGNSASYLTPTNISHNLGVAPEMMIIKCRSFGENWAVYHKDLGTLKYLVLDSNAAAATDTGHHWVDTAPTDSVFTIGHQDDVNSSGNTHIAYLFASQDGISKVGSFTYNGTTPVDVDCGFTNGARFVLIKCATAASDWILFDSERGIVAGNDPHLRLNKTDAENSSYDMIDPLSSGFTLNTVFGSNPQTYIFYAIA